MIAHAPRSIWAYRGFILGSVKREFQCKYRNSLLGALWTIINPLAMILVYTLIFSEVMRARLPGVENNFGFSIFLCAGLLPWGLFAEIVSRGQTVFIENANLIKKLNFPRLCLPVVVIANACLNFAIIFGLFLIFLLFSHNFPGLPVLALIPLLVILTSFAIGLGITLGVLNVFFRDVGQFFGIFLQFWFWFTPIIYPATALPEKMRPLLDLNPMTHLTIAFQDVLLRGLLPNFYTLWPVCILSVLLCIFGLWMFRRHASEMVDEL